MKKVMIIYSLVLVFGLIDCSNETSARQVDKEDDQANETKTSIERESEREAIDGEVETDTEGLNKNEGECLAEDEKIYRSNY